MADGISALRWGLTALFFAAVVWAMVGDLRSRRIPNWLALSLAALFFPAAFLAGLSWQSVAVSHGAAAFGVLVVGMGVFALGWLGGGDVKLMAAISLWVGWHHLPAFLIGTALAGGIVALVFLVVARVRGRRPDVPYGLAIGVGVFLVLPRLDTIPPGLAALFP